VNRALEIFRLEAGCQARRWPAWLYFALLLAVTFRLATEGSTENARAGGWFLNAPFVIASVTLLGFLMGLLATAALAGEAATRDVQTRMAPLVYTAPVSRASYLGGRFLAAFTVNAGVLLALPAAALLAALLPGADPALAGPFRPGDYLRAYVLFGLLNAFVTTALLFAAAALTRRAIASYVGAVVLLAGAMFNWLYVGRKLGEWALAKVLDPFGLAVMSEISHGTTAAQKNTLSLALDGPLLWTRLPWLGLALAVLTVTLWRFRFAHPVAGRVWRRGARGDADAPVRGAVPAAPRVARVFGGRTRARQVLVIATEAFRAVALGWGGLVMAGLAVTVVFTGPEMMEHIGVPLYPATEHIVSYFGTPGDLLWMVGTLLAAFYAGELVWREREAGLGEIADAAPAPEWVSLAGRLLGLGLVLMAMQALMAVAAMAVQAMLGYWRFELGVYARLMFGVQLVDYLLFAVLALAVHALVDHKYVGHLIVVLLYSVKAFAGEFGIEHNLLIYGSDPGLQYSDMRGFGPELAGFAWFKLYWGAWALLLAVAARLLWARGTERGPAARLRMARRRFTRPVVLTLMTATGLVVSLGGFVFYNTNVRNEYATADERDARRAEYERRYGRFRDAPQPVLAGTTLRVEIHPGRSEVEIRGRYRLVNRTAVPIDSIHVATDREAETSGVRFDRPARRVRADARLGHTIYALATPLRPGDSLAMSFRAALRPNGFANHGTEGSVAANGTFITPHEWLPAIGYQPARELNGAGERRVQGLPPRPAIRSLSDTAARYDLRDAQRMTFDATIGTVAGQTAVAPGRLVRTWTERGRRYFRYVADVPIRNDYAVFSAAYAVRDARWNPPGGGGPRVDIQIIHHPAHAWNVERMVRGVQASLDDFTTRLGPYPHGQLRLVEHPGRGTSLHGAPVNVWYTEGFSLLNPAADRRDLDFPFAVTAHEIAHQWWGNQLSPAEVEGGALLTESLAWYSAMGVVERTYGPEHLGRFMDLLREMYMDPRPQADVPLLRSSDWFTAYRKGPFAMYAVREYVGHAPVDGVLRRLIQTHGAGRAPLPTSLDLYAGLRSAAPDSLRYLLADLFEANTFWDLETRRAVVERASGGWRVTMEVRARKFVVDTAGRQTERPMNDLVEIGVYAPGAEGRPGAELYRRMHRIRAGEQRITVTVPREPALAGIDPRHLLIDPDGGDNLAAVTRAEAGPR
jgi:hypothetical protein